MQSTENQGYMNILLIKPPLNSNLITTSLYEPLELEYLAASVADQNVKILDMRIDSNLLNELNRFKPQVVGITAYTCDFNVVVQLLREIKEFDPQIRTVVGGNHATFLPGDFALPTVDAVFMGYADETFPQYIRYFDDPERIKKIPNIGIVGEGQIIYTQRIVNTINLDSLPLPNRHLTKKYRHKYHDPVRNNLSLVMTSRGCPFRCNFCACWKLMNGKYTARQPESIIEELKALPKEVDVVYFSDDNSFSDVKRMWKLSRLLKENNIRKKFQMYARADTIVKHPELFKDLKEAGLQFITVGLESFQNKDLEIYNKKTSVSLNTEAIKILKSFDIHVIAHFIVKPDYTSEDFDKLYNYIVSNNLFRPAFPVLTPLPGTELYQESFHTFRIKNYDYFDFAHSILPTKLPVEEFYRHLADLYSKSYSLQRYINYKISRLFSLQKNIFKSKNTDGITFIKLVFIYIFSKAMVTKIRKSYRIPSEIRKF